MIKGGVWGYRGHVNARECLFIRERFCFACLTFYILISICPLNSKAVATFYFSFIYDYVYDLPL